MLGGLSLLREIKVSEAFNNHTNSILTDSEIYLGMFVCELPYLFVSDCLGFYVNLQSIFVQVNGLQCDGAIIFFCEDTSTEGGLEVGCRSRSC